MKRPRSIAVNPDAVRRLMSINGYTSASLGKACGYSDVTVRQYVRNGRMSPEMFEAAINLLHTTPEELRGEK